MKKLIVALFAFLAAAELQAFLIGPFPGLEALIDQADAIVILRVDETGGDSFASDPYTIHRCFIYQCLKGDIASNSWIPLRLMDPRSPVVSPFARHSTHLVFLTKKRSPDEPTEYRTLEIEGASIRVSPFGNESMPEGATTPERIRSVLKTAMAYWADQEKKEREFMQVVLSEERQPNKTPEGTP